MLSLERRPSCKKCGSGPRFESYGTLGECNWPMRAQRSLRKSDLSLVIGHFSSVIH